MAIDRPREAEDALTLAARALQSTSDADDILERIVDAAVATIDACDYAGISVDHRGRASSPVVSDPAALAIDELQYEIGQGPCLEAMRGDDPAVESADLEHEPRWTQFGARAAQQGIHSVVAHRLYVDSQRLGSINLYSTVRDGFTDEDRRQAIVLSGLASLAVNSMRLETESGGLQEALRTRDLIGQAKGILMERHGCDGATAFDRLREISQHDNRKLRDVAQSLVDDRDSAPDPVG